MLNSSNRSIKTPTLQLIYAFTLYDLPHDVENTKKKYYHNIMLYVHVLHAYT